MILGKCTAGEPQSALRAPSDAPSLGDFVPPGRALWATGDDAAEAVQVWYAPQSDLAADLAARMSAVDPADRIVVAGSITEASS